MRFPLADWIDSHSDAPHNLGQSGMRGTLPSLESALQRPEAPDEGALVAQLAELVGVPKERLFLTHGASEGNALVLVFLAHELSGAASRAPRFSVLAPEYPPLSDCAGWAGLRPTGTDGPAEIVALSDPNNPTGVVRRDTDEVRHLGREAKAILVDETFREFTTAASQAATPDPLLWATGTFTKAYGADRIRVGFVVAPEGDRSSFARFHGVMTDEIPPASVASARAILRDRERILAESRARL
ncbi:MAG: aminotransferase class I/II-fold pyridoxal phosphate-dependent enzyme, partial [Thermoplasmata archaeon]|nr:aminotransferase class I/II-fold pyridoxal phosphate-dependent enzyme [Thermoplasmata archaeon]